MSLTREFSSKKTLGGAHPRSFPLANDLAKTVERAETLPTIHLGARDFLPTPMTEH
jgi:hypothetical protein